jgi:alkylation response protein AidB-like acyl-CoA dehydrogenase
VLERGLVEGRRLGAQEILQRCVRPRAQWLILIDFDVDYAVEVRDSPWRTGGRIDAGAADRGEAPMLLIGEGTAEIQKMIIGRRLLEEYRIG